MTNNLQKPILLSAGEPAGIAPEITAKAWKALKDELVFVFMGDVRTLPEGTPYQEIKHLEAACEVMPKALPVLPYRFPAPVCAGVCAPQNAPTIMRTIKDAVEFIVQGKASSLCTNPIQKKALYEGADFSFPGHTEFLAHLRKRSKVAMMLVGKTLRVVPATIHIPLRAVADVLTKELLESTLRLTHEALCNDFATPNPSIAVAGMNPHAGEGGTIGDEERHIITPTLEKLRKEGLHLAGPLPADTLFHPESHKNFDAIVCMYHDQALIPFKAAHFNDGVNVTLGLDMIRTSPDHGTALDIAGQNKACPSSLIEALRMGEQLARQRRDMRGRSTDIGRAGLG